ncbi:M14 family zinc carboxypeptidase [Paenibacillus rhizoplanae]
MLLASLFVTAGRVHAAANIVNPNQVYSYTIMQRDIERLAAEYPDLVSMESLGKSPYGRQLWAVKLGRGESVLFLNGSHHAREWMTSSLLMKLIDTYAQAYDTNVRIGNYNVRDLLDEVSIWVVPMVNPDGVTLSQQGTAGLPADLAQMLRKYNKNSTNFYPLESQYAGH